MGSIAIRTIDLFCGAGGSSHGAQNADDSIEIIAGFDNWKPALKIFKANFPNAKVFGSDIRRILPVEIKSELGRVDLMLASPECTNHSRAKGAGKRSEQSKKTAFQVLIFAKVLRPTWIVVENVVGMKSWKRYDEFISKLKYLGYFVAEFQLNANDYSVPQSRERVFILCSLIDEPGMPVQDSAERVPVSLILSENSYPFRLLHQEGRAEATIIKAERAIDHLGEDTPFLIVYYGAGRDNNGGWQKVSDPLRTVTTLDRFAYVIPGENGEGHLMRMLQPEELKLAMGFDQAFILSDVPGLNRRKRIKLMGNAVCPPVMKAIVKSLISQKGI